MQAYYNILTNLKAKLEADEFVNTVTQGDIFDIDLTKQTIFPLAHIIVNDVTKAKNILQFNVTVMCMDIVDLSKDETTDIFLGNDNEQDVLNTQLAVGLRLVELLERGSGNTQFMMRGEPTFEGFTERFENNIAGWAVTFDIHVPNTMTSCDDISLSPACSPVTVANSNGIYNVSVSSGGSLVLPNPDVLVNGTTEGSIVSITDVAIDVTTGGSPTTPDSITITGNTVAIDLSAPVAAVVGASLLKTGQTTSYRTGDDGDEQAGRDVDWFTLNYTNPFGNTNRFTDELGGSAYTNDIVIDWSTYDGSTVLGVYRIPSSGNVSWAVAIDDSLALSVGVFTSGWRLWNQAEMFYLIYMGSTGNVYGYAPLSLSVGSYWTSTHDPDNSANAVRNAYSGTLAIGVLDKTAAQRRLTVRTFTVTGTTLT